jgi:hypothetical protein
MVEFAASYTWYVLIFSPRLDQQAAALGPDDYTRYNPWRAPGTAPTFGPCGMAGGGPVAGVESGEYNTTQFAKQGALPPLCTRATTIVYTVHSHGSN